MGARLAAVLAGANLVAVVYLWASAGGISDVHDAATLLTSAGRLTGLVGAWSALVQLLLLARIPGLTQFDRLTAWHRRNGIACLTLLLAHTVLIVAGYTVGDGISLPAELRRLIRGYPGVITATAGLVLLAGVVVTSATVVRRRLRYETWWFAHLYAYLAIALAFSHQIATGTSFVGDAVARAYWVGLYVAVLAVLVGCRILLPLVRFARHRLRVERVVHEAPGVVSIEVGGRRLDRLRARSGQFFLWRFLTRGRWFEAHPFSLSAAPDGKRLRITVKALGDFTAGLGSVRPGTPVLVEGPLGGLPERQRQRSALIAGGVGIAPVRALLEDLPGDVAVIYRAHDAGDLILRDELEQLARRRGARVHYVLGEPLSAEQLRRLVPDIAARDVFVCGSPAMTASTRASLLAAAVPRRQIVTERLAL